MNLEQLYFIAEIIAAAAVVISLIYLALQVKQARIQNKTAAMDLIATKRADFMKLLATDKELSFIVSQGLSGKKLSNLDYYRFTNYLYTICVNLEIAYHKYLLKDINSEAWRAWNEGCNGWFMCPGFQKWWQHNHVGGFTESFKNHVNQSIKNCNSEASKQQQKVISFLKSIENISAINTKELN